jgi:hypothetical protein
MFFRKMNMSNCILGLCSSTKCLFKR